MLILTIFSILIFGNHWTNVACYSKYSSEPFFLNKNLNVNPRVIGGKPVVKTSNWGWNAIIKAYNSTSKKVVYNEIYGGTLIGNRWILTAASVFKYAFAFSDYTKFTVDLGVDDRNKTNPWSITNQAIEEIFIYPKYNAYGSDFAGYYFSSREFYNPYYYDIALVKLKKPIELNDKIFAVNLPSDDCDKDSAMIDILTENTMIDTMVDSIPQNTGFIVGFGQNGGWNASEYLEGVKLKILSDKKCVQAFENYNTSYLTTYDFNSKIQICAGENDVPKSFCACDIGGGLNVKDRNGEWTIKGIASAASIIYGNDVCNGANFGTNYTGLFTRVAAFKPWITKILLNH